jgi:uncharacterized membrane protein YiaA
MPPNPQHGPTAAFVGAAWLALIAGALTYMIGLCWFSVLLAILLLVTVQKNVRDVAVLKTAPRPDHVS